MKNCENNRMWDIGLVSITPALEYPSISGMLNGKYKNFGLFAFWCHFLGVIIVMEGKRV